MSKYATLLNQFVEEEYSAQLKWCRTLWRQPIAKRVESGYAIDNVGIVEVNREWASLHLIENRSEFSVGDHLRLSQSDPDGAYVRCMLEGEESDYLTVSPSPLQSFRKLKKSDGWVLDIDVVDHRQPFIAALDALRAGKTLSARTISALLDGAKAEFDLSRDAETRARIGRLKLSVKQHETVVRAMTTSNYWAVQGAPTTGKTYTLIHLAIALAREGRRVLITGPDDFCINYALRQIHELSGHQPTRKIGNPHRDEGLGDAIKINETFTASALHPTDRGLIIGALPTTVSLDDSLGAVEFDTVLIDDAERVSLPAAICAMLAGRRYIFFGDPAGTPPTVYGQHSNRTLTSSIFSYAAQFSPGTALDMSFHMNAQLLEFPNKNFYRRRLRAAPEVMNQTIELKIKPPWPRFQEILHPAQSAVFIENAHKGNHIVSPDEARVAAWVAMVATVGCQFPAERVAVLAFYRAQARLAYAEAVKLAKSRGEMLPDGIFFGTPEDLRHEGRDLIIISLATSNFKHALAREDTVFSLHRLNMALTRASVKRIVIGSPYLLQAKPPLKIADWLARIRDLAQESKRVVLKIKPTPVVQDLEERDRKVVRKLK